MRASHVWLNALWAAEKPVITAVNGVAAGAGFGFALIGDIILASKNAFFKGGFSSLGAAPDYGLGFTLPRAVGAVRAAEILFSDRRVTADEALAIGMVGQVLPAENFAADAIEFARATAGLPRGAQLTKRLLRLESADAFARYLDLEAETQTEAFQSQDFAEGVAAFREKRKPVFRGS
jgi:2-(1,2-epoxy-1,2-dihydrophenyl)acetyl-CoA isomerase